jgi:hypothetical protein
MPSTEIDAEQISDVHPLSYPRLFTDSQPRCNGTQEDVSESCGLLALMVGDFKFSKSCISKHVDV